MNDDGGYTIYCPKCGAAMSSTARYCMKCGTLNYDHEANKNMLRYLPKKKQKDLHAKNRTFLPSTKINETTDTNNHGDSLRMSVSSKTGNKTVCFIINFLFYLGLLVLSFFVSVQGTIDLDTIMASPFPKLAIPISFTFLFLYSLELIFMKCNTSWWKALVPFYNAFVLGDIAFQNKWIGILSFIPGVNVIYQIILFYKLGESFNYNKYLAAIFSVIYIPIMGFGTHVYNGYVFVSGNSQKETEREYQYRKIFFFTIVIVIILGFSLMFIHGLTSSGNEENFLDRLYFTYTSRSLVSKVSSEAKNKNIICKDGEYSQDGGIYYFEFEDVGDQVFLLFYVMREPISGYVIVDNTSGESVYKVSLSDGTFGFDETKSDEVNLSSLKKHTIDFKKNKWRDACEISN